MSMTKIEIQEHFEAMTNGAKKLIKEGKNVQEDFYYGIRYAAAQMGGGSPEHAIYCFEEGERRVKELMGYSQQRKSDYDGH